MQNALQVLLIFCFKKDGDMTILATAILIISETATATVIHAAVVCLTHRTGFH